MLQAQQQLQNTKNQAIQQSTDFRTELILRFRNEIAEFAQDIAKQRGGKLVMLAGQETLWFDSSADITDEVIALIRKRSSEFKESGEANNALPAEEKTES
ncbi:MAG: OmpH family outer membrane protein [Pseudomonadota bacterium]